MEKKKKIGTIQNHLGKMSGQTFATIFEKTKHQIWV
jgi:hypothetical protein